MKSYFDKKIRISMMEQEKKALQAGLLPVPDVRPAPPAGSRN